MSILIKPKLELKTPKLELNDSITNPVNKQGQNKRKWVDDSQQNQMTNNQNKKRRKKNRHKGLQQVNNTQIKQLANVINSNSKTNEKFGKKQIVIRADWNKWKAEKENLMAKRLRRDDLNEWNAKQKRRRKLKKQTNNELKKITNQKKIEKNKPSKKKSDQNNAQNNETTDKPKTKKEKKRERLQKMTDDRLSTLRSSIKNLLKFRNFFHNDEVKLMNSTDYQHSCTTITKLIPSLLQPKKYNRFTKNQFNFDILDEIVKQAARLEPKIFNKASVFNYKSIGENEYERKDLQLQVRVLWALSASVCIFGYVSINKRSKEECMAEVVELRDMAEDLKDHPDKFDCSALVDLLISWQMSFNAKYKVLPNLAIFVFVMRLNGNNFKQIMEALCNDDTNVSDEGFKKEEDDIDDDIEQNEESDKDESDDEEEDDEEDVKEIRKVIKSEVREDEENLTKNKIQKSKNSDIKEEEESEDEKEEEDSEDEVVVNSQVLKNARKALGNACFGEGQTSDNNSEDWNLDDERLFALDNELVKAFRKQSSKIRNEKLSEFKQRLVGMLSICFTVAKLELALPSWLSTITMICEYKNANQELVDCMERIEKPLIRRKKECKFDNKQLAIFLSALIAPFQKDDNDNRLYSRHNQSLVYGGIRVLVCLSRSFCAKEFPPETYQFVNHLREICDNKDEKTYNKNYKEFVRKLLFKLSSNFTSFKNL